MNEESKIKYYNEYADFVERLEFDIVNLNREKRMIEDKIQYQSGRLENAKSTLKVLTILIMEKQK